MQRGDVAKGSTATVKRRMVSMFPILITLNLLCLGARGSDDNDLESFKAWFSRPGGRFEGIDVAHGKYGTGLVVTRSAGVDDMDRVMSVPLKQVLCRTTLTSPPTLGAHIYEKVGQDADLIALFLAFERSRGGKSGWAPYINMLPEEAPVCSSLTDSELKELQDPTLERDCAWRRQQLTNRWHQHLGFYRDLVAELKKQKKGKVSESELTLERWMWGHSMVSSRAWTIRGVRYLVPGADMFNYEPHTEVRAHQSGEAFLTYHRIDGDRVSILADRSAEKGEELFEDYGDNPDHIYLTYHGFVPDNNPFATVKLVIPPHQADHSRELQWVRTELYRSIGIKSAATWSLTADLSRMKNVDAERLELFLRIRSLSATHLKQCEEKSKTGAEISVRECLPEMSGETRDEVYAKMLPDLKQRLEGFPTTADKDQRLLQKATDPKLVEAIKYRLRQKEILITLINMFSKLDSDKGQEVLEEAKLPKPQGASTTGPKSSLPVWPDVESEEFLEKAMEEFNQWVEENQFPVQKIKGTYTKDMRFGVITTEEIAAEELYLAVPRRVLIDENSASESEIGWIFDELDKRFSPDMFHKIVLFLLYELGKGNDSFWAPYIRILPKSFAHTPMKWPEETMALLEGTRIPPDAEEMKAAIARKWSGVKKHVIDSYSEFDGPTFDFEHYTWATHILNSRSIWWDRARHLVPLLDLINCQEGPNPKRVHQTTLSSNKQTADTHAGWAFSAGEPLYENYGQSNQLYLMYHGFTLDPNSHDCVYMDFATQDPEAIQNLGSHQMKSTKSTCVSAEKMSEALQWLTVAYGEDKAISEFELVVDDRIKAIPSTRAEDKAMLKRDDLASDVRAAIAYRLTVQKALYRLKRKLQGYDTDGVQNNDGRDEL